jgi:hypothetical protein
MEVIFIEGDATAFKVFIDAHYADNTVELRNVDGWNCWVIKREDGTEYVAWPECDKSVWLDKYPA